MKTCKDCLFSNLVLGPQLECRINPPNTALLPNTLGGTSQVSFFPKVNPDQWCGQLKLESDSDLEILIDQDTDLEIKTSRK